MLEVKEVDVKPAIDQRDMNVYLSIIIAFLVLYIQISAGLFIPANKLQLVVLIVFVGLAYTVAIDWLSQKMIKAAYIHKQKQIMKKSKKKKQKSIYNETLKSFYDEKLINEEGGRADG